MRSSRNQLKGNSPTLAIFSKLEKNATKIEKKGKFILKLTTLSLPLPSSMLKLPINTNEGSAVKGSTGDYGMHLMIVHFAPGDPFLEGHDNFSGAKSCFMSAVFAFKI